MKDLLAPGQSHTGKTQLPPEPEIVSRIPVPPLPVLLEHKAATQTDLWLQDPSLNSTPLGQHGHHHAIAFHGRTRSHSTPLQPVVQGLWQQGPITEAAPAPEPARAPACRSVRRSQKKRASEGR